MQVKNLKKLNRLLYLLNILDSGEIQVPFKLVYVLSRV